MDSGDINWLKIGFQLLMDQTPFGTQYQRVHDAYDSFKKDHPEQYGKFSDEASQSLVLELELPKDPEPLHTNAFPAYNTVTISALIVFTQSNNPGIYNIEIKTIVTTEVVSAVKNTGSSYIWSAFTADSNHIIPPPHVSIDNIDMGFVTTNYFTGKMAAGLGGSVSFSDTFTPESAWESNIGLDEQWFFWWGTFSPLKLKPVANSNYHYLKWVTGPNNIQITSGGGISIDESTGIMTISGFNGFANDALYDFKVLFDVDSSGGGDSGGCESGIRGGPHVFC